MVSAQTQTQVSPDVKIGKWQGGNLLARASWRTVMAAKEILWLQLLSLLVGSVVTAFIVLVVWYFSGVRTFSQLEPMINSFSWQWLIPFIVNVLVNTFIGYYFMAALVAIIFHQFQGEKVSLEYGLAQANKKLSSIIRYSIFVSTLGSVFMLLSSLLEDERIPVVGKVLVWWPVLWLRLKV